MKKSTVALIRCAAYDTNVEQAVKKGLALIGGLDHFISATDRVLIKPNVVAGEEPARAISPHPVVFKAVAELTLGISRQVAYGDSPGVGRVHSSLKRCGLAGVAEELGLSLADFEKGREVVFHDSPFTKKFTIANGVLESDALISLCKLKAHKLTRLTGAVKNQFGCIPGLQKVEYHLKMPNSYDFAKMLVALNLLLKPRLYIMDAVMAMQGNGPRNGDPTPMNCLLFSSDPVALDAVAARLVNLDPNILPTSAPGKDWGLGVYEDVEIKVVGDPLESFVNKDFDVERKPIRPVTNSRGVSTLKNWISPRPEIENEACITCGICVQHCPVIPKAVNWLDGNKKQPPVYHYSRCIRCFCCQELCPENAIHVETPWLGRLLKR